MGTGLLVILFINSRRIMEGKECLSSLNSVNTKIERIKLLIGLEESVNGHIALTFELGLVLRDLMEEKGKLECQVSDYKSQKNTINVSQAIQVIADYLTDKEMYDRQKNDEWPLTYELLLELKEKVEDEGETKRRGS